MTRPPPDVSRDRRIEDPTNLYMIHPLGRALLPGAIKLGLSANHVSLLGLVLGAGAAFSYSQWQDWRFAVAGLILSIAWLVADGLDGMIARATQTASALGRALDGICDHGVFILIYVTLAISIGTVDAWTLAIAAGLAHVVQSSLYEGERTRFHRRSRGIAVTQSAAPDGALPVRLYDALANSISGFAQTFETTLADSPHQPMFASAYAQAAVGPMRLMTMLTANWRVWVIFGACLTGNPKIFWWVELIPLTFIMLVGVCWHRLIERRLVRAALVGAEMASANNYKEKGYR